MNRTWKTLLRRCIAACALTAWVGVAGQVRAVPLGEEEPDRLEAKPQRLGGVDLEERFGARVPLDTAFVDTTGRAVRLGDYFDGQRPVVLTFNYSNCPMLCNLQLGRFVNGLKQLSRTPGEDFQVVTISIDPAEKPQDAAKSQTKYLSDYGRPEAARGWHFLVGGEVGARAVADSVGFSYDYNEERQEWLHPAAVVLLTPEGKVSRYLYGIEYHPDTLNLAIVEASEGKIGTVMDRLILYCFHYDESEGRYAPVAMNIMRVGAGLVAVVLAVFLGTYWWAESRRRRKSPLAPSTVP